MMSNLETITDPHEKSPHLCSIESDENIHHSSSSLQHSTSFLRPTDSIAKFTYKNKTYRALAKSVTPSELAKRFKIRVDGIRVHGNNREYKIIQDKDIFSPLLAPASYEIVYDSKEHIASIIEIKPEPIKHQNTYSGSHHHHHHSHEEARERSHSDAAKKTPGHKDSTKIKIFFNEKLFEENNVLNVQPSVISEYFEIETSKLKLSRKGVVYEVNERKNCFEPDLVTGKYQLIFDKCAENGSGEEMNEMEIQECCFLVGRTGILKHDCTKNTVEDVLQRVGETSPESIKLLNENGSVVNFNENPIFEPQKTYYIIYNPTPSEPLKFPSVKYFYAGLTLNRPLSFMAPYLIAVLRAMSILSHTDVEKTPLKPTKHDHAKKHNLICNTSISTAAFQVTYRINDVAKSLHLITNKIANDKIDYLVDSENEFEDSSDAATERMMVSEFVMDFPGCNLDPVLKLLKKALIDVEEMLDLVVENMKEKQPNVKSVETALIVEKGKHQRREQKITFENIVDENDEGEYRQIAQKDYRILPNTTVAEVAKNRKHFDYIFHLTDKIIKAHNSNDPDYKDIAHLLNITGEVLHAIYLHWRFFQEFLNYQDAYFGKDQKRLSVSDVCLTVSQQLKSCAIMWNFIGQTLPYFIELGNDKNEVAMLWDSYKADINAAQHSLEICYLTKKYLINN